MILAYVAIALAGAVRLPPPAGGDAAFRGERLALVIGPESFADPAFPALQFADDDAEAVSDALTGDGHFDRVWTLTDPVATSADGIRDAMAEIGAIADSPEDTVFVYVSSHGTLAHGSDGRLAPFVVASDTRLDAVARTAVPQAEVVTWLDGLPSRQKVAVFATCHSGQGKSALPADVRDQLASTKGDPIVPLYSVSEATIVIGVCAFSETARESSQLGHDVYTAYFLEALQPRPDTARYPGDADADGAVTVTEAHEYARTAAFAYTGGTQRAWARAEVLGEDPIILSGARAQPGAALAASYRRSLDGYGVRVDGQDKGVLPGQVVLDPGAHRLELVAPNEGPVVARQRVNVASGRRVDIESVLGRDHVRFGAGGGAVGFGVGPASAPLIFAEAHLPRLLGGAWEVVGQGSTTLRWPQPTLSGSLVVERPFAPGTVQLRAGVGLQGWLLQAAGDPPLLSPTITPVPVLAVAWTPPGFAWARLAGSGGALWYTDAGVVHVGWTAQLTLAMGVGI